MLLEIKNIGSGPLVVKDKYGELHSVASGQKTTVIGPAQGRLIDGVTTKYRCTQLD